jgi:hypothetical protein
VWVEEGVRAADRDWRGDGNESGTAIGAHATEAKMTTAGEEATGNRRRV